MLTTYVTYPLTQTHTDARRAARYG